MTKYEALRILGLDEYASEEEIKKAYRNLAKKYHPDNFTEGSFEQKKAIEKMQEVNNAKDTLDKIMKNGDKQNNYQQSRNYQQSYMDIEKYKKEMVEKLSRYNSSNSSINDLTNYHNEIVLIIFNFESYIKDFTNKQKIDNAYNLFKISIKDIFEKLKLDFFKKYEINESTIIETINYECNLEEFYKQLLKIKEKYDLKEIYRKKIEQDLHDYKLRVGYDYLKEYIEIGINNILIRLKTNNYTNYEEELKKGKKEIDEVFDLYFSYITQFNEIRKFLDSESLTNIKISEIYTLFKSTWDRFNNHTSLYDTGENLEKINSLIEEYKKHKQLLKELQSLNEHIKTIINNYNNALQSFTYPAELAKAELATKLLNEVFETIRQAEKGLVSIDSCKQLINLKFINYDEDKSILNSVNGMNNSKNIYIRNCAINSFNDIALGKIIAEDNNNVTIQGITYLNIFNQLEKETFQRKKFNEMYISLENFLKNAKFCGYQEDIINSYIIIYSNDLFNLVYNLNTQSILVNQKKEISKKFCSESIPFKDINYTIDYIDNFLKQKEKELEDCKIKKRGKIR